MPGSAMVWEAAAAFLVGLLALWIVFQPLFAPGSVRPPVYEPLDPSETRRGVALAALKELEFDRATGKISDEDYRTLHERYTAEALAVLREDEAAEPGEAASPPRGAPSDVEVEALIAARVRSARDPQAAAALACRIHGARPERDAVFCSDCGARLEPACPGCGAALPAEARFCDRCGGSIAA